MSPIWLVLRQMQQRALSTSLTVASVMLGVALAVAVMIARREGQALFAHTDYGFDTLVGAKGSPLQLVINTVYHLDRSPGNVPYTLYQDLAGKSRYDLVIPVAVGDNYRGYRIVGTTPAMLGVGEDGEALTGAKRFQVRPGVPYEVADGRVFHPRKFEAVVGSAVAEATGLRVGSTFQASHDLAGMGNHAHAETWTVVGVLKPTATANDRVIFVSLPSFLAVAEHAHGLEAAAKLKTEEGAATQDSGLKTQDSPEAGRDHEHDHDHGHDDHGHGHAHDDGHAAGACTNPAHDHLGEIVLALPAEKLAVSAILVKSKSFFVAQDLKWRLNNGNVAQAVSPGEVMREFFGTFLEPITRLLLWVSMLVTVVAAISILVSIYNAIAARQREIAILRALGATRRKVVLLICLEAGAIGLIGGVLGVVLGHAVAAVGGWMLEGRMGASLAWWHVAWGEVLYLGAVVLVALAAGLVPALKAYRVPVADHLTT